MALFGNNTNNFWQKAKNTAGTVSNAIGTLTRNPVMSTLGKVINKTPSQPKTTTTSTNSTPFSSVMPQPTSAFSREAIEKAVQKSVTPQQRAATTTTATPSTTRTSSVNTVSGGDPYAGLTGADRQAAIERAAGINTQVRQPTPQPQAQPQVEQPDPQVNMATAPPRDSFRDQIEAIRRQLTGVLAPTAEEAQLANELNEHMSATRMGVIDEEGQGRGKNLGLVRGRQEKLLNQGLSQSQTLEQRLQNLQAQREAKRQALATELGFLDQEVQRRDAQSQPFEFGGNLVRMNPATGQLETVAEGPQAAPEPIILSAGQTIIDPNTGEVLFTAPNKPEAVPTAVQEYMFAAQQGYKGSFADWKASGEGSGSLTATQAKNTGFYNRATAAEQAMKAALNQGDMNLFVQGKLPNVLKSEQYQKYKQAAESWIKAILRQESGAAIPQEEIESYMDTYFPQPGDKAGTIAQKEAMRREAMEALIIGSPTSGMQHYDPLGLGFNTVGADTKAGTNPVGQALTTKFKPGQKAGQCGRFVNNLTGIGMGNEFEQKMSKTDPSIGTPQNPPRPGDVFVMPYSWTGHTGLVAGVTPKNDGTYDLHVVDSNWDLDEKIKHHTINSSKVTGYARTALKLA